MLTKREAGMIPLIAAGLSNGQIGAYLYLSEDTIKTHMRRMFRKTGARDRAHLVTWAFRTGWLI